MYYDELGLSLSVVLFLFNYVICLKFVLFFCGMVSFCIKFSFSLLKHCIFFYPNYIFCMIRSCLSDRICYINYCKRYGVPFTVFLLLPPFWSLPFPEGGLLKKGGKALCILCLMK